jgi:hypothetical protein
MVAPLVASLLVRRLSPFAGLAGMVGGGATMAIWKWVLHEPGELPAILAGVLASALLTAVFGAMKVDNVPSLFAPGGATNEEGS